MHTVRAGELDMPALGLGTMMLKGAAGQEMIETALQIGYRHLDTAYIYRNEAEVGAAMRASGLARSEIFLTTKIWRDFFHDGELQRQARASLERLGVDQVDLLLLHWPVSAVPLAETIAALNEVKREGLTRAIGVSNFPSALIEQAAALAESPLAADQIEYHPYLSQRAVLRTCRRHGMALTAYSPLAQGVLLDDPVLSAIAATHRRTTSQIALRWLVQQEGVAAIPRTSSPARAKENLEVFDFSLSDQEMAALHGLDRGHRTYDELEPAFAWDPA